MSEPLLASKFHVPRLRANLVARPRLSERLDEGVNHKLILLIAPAGFGKTTALSTWITRSNRRVAWLSLDEADNDPIRFWTYFVAALRNLRSDLGGTAQAWIDQRNQQSRPASIEPFLTILLAEIASIPDEFAFVLEDYHVIASQEIHRNLAFLLDYLPPNMHLVISSRADPPLPLARLRVRDQLVELRTDDLRFTPEEAVQFLNQVMGLYLSAENIAALEARTEGWIAGLQLAALSLQGRADTDEFIASFAGSNRFVLDYLVDEVLQNQPEDVQSFLLETAILDRFTGSLCDAVTGQGGGQQRLERLEESNLFIVALDDKREWYRYQHLFADVLSVRLQQTRPERIPELHRRAAAWLEAQGLTLEAITHALAGADFDLAVRLITALNQSEPQVLLNWFQSLPDELVRSRPELCLEQAYALLAMKRFTEAEARLQDAERSASGIPVMLGKIAVARATVAAVRGDSERAIQFGRQAQAYLPPDIRFQHGALEMSLGIAYRLKGDVAAARRVLSQAASLERPAGNLVIVTALCELGCLDALESHLHAANERYEQALAMATVGEEDYLPIAIRPQVHLGLLQYEWSHLELAAQHFEIGIRLSQDWWMLPTLIEGYLGLARLHQASGDLEAIHQSLAQAEQLARANELPHMVAVVDARRAELSIAQGDFDGSTSWANAQLNELGTSDELTQMGYQVRVALARYLIARGRRDPQGSFLPDANHLLGQMLRAIQRAGHTGREIEILMLQALCLQAQGNGADALRSLVRSLVLAEPERYVRLFVDEGEAMQLSLRMLEDEAAIVRPADSFVAIKEYIHSLLSAFAKERTPPAVIAVPHSFAIATNPRHSGAAVPPRGATALVPSLPEPLSEREFEVLRLLATELSTADIARELVITVGTVRNHVKSIYGKLNAHNRLQAVEHARALRLL